jgi:hypothetical protein
MAPRAGRGGGRAAAAVEEAESDQADKMVEVEDEHVVDE